MKENDALGSLHAEHTPDAIRLRLNTLPSPSLARDAILGATDGCVTTFAVVAGATGGSLSEGVIVILGFANLLADGFSMAASNFLGALTLNEELEEAKAEETRQIEKIPEGEKEEVRQIFAAKGFSGELLENVVTVITGDRRLWVQTMITDELGLRSGDARPVRAAGATFAAFCLSGFVPLIGFVLPGIPLHYRFGVSSAMTVADFFLIGFFKGLILKRRPWKSGRATLLLGSAAAVLAYATGFIIRRIMG